MGDGKSTFGAQMSPQYLVLNFDGRWQEQVDTAAGKSHIINTGDVLDAVNQMEQLLPALKDKTGTVIVDSGTTFLDGVIARGALEEARAKAAGKSFNMNQVMRQKADTMRVLRAAIMKYQCNSLWIFHLEDSALSGQKKVRTTIPAAELERLKINLNAILTIVKGNTGMRGIKVEWCRYNNDVAKGQVVWDFDGMWVGVPAKLKTFLEEYHGDEGYNGNVYSYDWLVGMLEDKGVKITVEELKKKYGAEPLWFDRNAYGRILKAAAA